MLCIYLAKEFYHIGEEFAPLTAGGGIFGAAVAIFDANLIVFPLYYIFYVHPDGTRAGWKEWKRNFRVHALITFFAGMLILLGAVLLEAFISVLYMEIPL